MREEGNILLVYRVDDIPSLASLSVIGFWRTEANHNSTSNAYLPPELAKNKLLFAGPLFGYNGKTGDSSDHLF